MSSFGTVRTFLKLGTCSETLCHVLNREFDHPLEPEEHASLPFAGGIMQHGYQCGLIWGAVLAAGAQAHRLYGAGPQAEAKAIIAADRLVESFRDRNGNVNCVEITDLDKSSSNMQMFMYFLVKGGSIGCFRRAASYANIAHNEISAAFAEEDIDAPCHPVSCAAELARRMGASDMQSAMVAGFAGGVGLSGGACGALGAAIWMIGLNSIENGAEKVELESPGAEAAIERFLKCTDYEFECAKIVGRMFENVGAHADYLAGGGCSQVIDALAAGQTHRPSSV